MTLNKQRAIRKTLTVIKEIRKLIIWRHGWYWKYMFIFWIRRYKLQCRFGKHIESNLFDQCLNPYCNKKIK